MAVNAQKRRRGLIAVVAALIAAGAFVVALTMHDSGGAPGSGAGAQATPAATIPVVVAIIEIKPGDTLSSTNVAVKQLPAAAIAPVAPGTTAPYFQDTVSLLAAPHYASIDLAAGTVLQNSMLVTSAASAKPVVSGVIDLKPGDVALSIPYDSAKGAGGYIQTEDRIDIIVDDGGVDPKSPGGAVRYAFQDVRVIHLGSAADKGTGTGSLLLIELTREKAAAVSYLQDKGANFRFFIRPRDTYTKGVQPNSGPVDGSNWLSFLDG